MKSKGALVGLLFCSGAALASTQIPLAPLTIHTHHQAIKVKVQIASTPASTQRGLMYRHHLPANQGMLFRFKRENTLSFWMKNTFIPLDIFFINKRRQIVNIQTMTPCRQTDCPVYQSRLPALYALEMNAGFAKQHRIVPGNTISFAD